GRWRRPASGWHERAAARCQRRRVLRHAAGCAALLPGADFRTRLVAVAHNEGGRRRATRCTWLARSDGTIDATGAGDPGLRRALLARAGSRMGEIGVPTALRRRANAGDAG